MATRTKTIFNVAGFPEIKSKLYAWAAESNPMAWYDSNSYPHQESTYDAVLALKIRPKSDIISSYDSLQRHLKSDWFFGFFTYEFSHAWESIQVVSPQNIAVPTLQFFSPEKLWLLKGDTLTALYDSDDNAITDFENIKAVESTVKSVNGSINLVPKITKKEYLKKAASLQEHIFRGDIYEVNYCMEWFAEKTQINPTQLFHNLNAVAKTPFSAYLAMDNLYLMCASPERFLKRSGTTVMSQPIKGTAARHIDNVLDKSAAEMLKNDPKERAENIMITDLVRNDLSRVAQRGSVTVTEQCAVYPFAQVHQMISTISATCSHQTSSLDVIDACFPMGSMTGAPKQRAMELIHTHEVSQRGLYSGAVGYFDPNGDFDFNVVIRSLIYDAQKQYLSTHVGSAITAASNIDKEYDECQLKAAAIKRVLANEDTVPIGHGTKI